MPFIVHLSPMYLSESVGKEAVPCMQKHSLLVSLIFNKHKVSFQGKWLSDYLSPLLECVYVGGGN